MRRARLSSLALLIVFLLAACGSNKSDKKEKEAAANAPAVPDTGFTGIKQYKNGNYMIKEVTFKNGIKDGLLKTFYVSGQVYQTFWFENGLREDSACWYYLEGQLFRTTPFKHDTVDGIQKQFYKNGALRAKIGYRKGMRTSFFEEYNSSGKRVGPYPEITVDVKDNYKVNGSYIINLGLTDRGIAAKFYRGAFIDDRFDSTACKPVALIRGVPSIILRKSQNKGTDHIDVIASVPTNLGNRYLEYKKIEIPYQDLN